MMEMIVSPLSLGPWPQYNCMDIQCREVKNLDKRKTHNRSVECWNKAWNLRYNVLFFWGALASLAKACLSHWCKASPAPLSMSFCHPKKPVSQCRTACFVYGKLIYSGDNPCKWLMVSDSSGNCVDAGFLLGR